MNWLFSTIFIFLIKGYQMAVSPLFVSTCRFDPTCSNYGIEAIKKHGPVKGVYLTVRRIISCHPWGKHGYDQVP